MGAREGTNFTTPESILTTSYVYGLKYSRLSAYDDTIL